jgi:hypothetical protein
LSRPAAYRRSGIPDGRPVVRGVEPCPPTARVSAISRQLQLTFCNVVSSDRTHANIRVDFNQPVGPADLPACLSLTDADASDICVRLVSPH